MREKNGGGWVDRGELVRMRDGLVRTRDGSMEVGQRRTRTRDGSVSMRDGSAEWDGSAKYPLLARLGLRMSDERSSFSLSLGVSFENVI